jgi:hypothetical protein
MSNIAIENMAHLEIVDLENLNIVIFQFANCSFTGRYVTYNMNSSMEIFSHSLWILSIDGMKHLHCLVKSDF